MTSPSPSGKAQVNLPLEGLRGIACLMVALGHSLYLNHLDYSIQLSPWLRSLEAAQNGVLVFFVLSGYLIGWTNSGPFTPESRRAYVWRRFVRLAPIYYVAVALTAFMVFQLRLPGQLRTLAGALVGLQNFNAYFLFEMPPPGPNGPLWSLNYEILYYLLFLLLWRFQPKLTWVFLPALVLSILAWFAPAFMPAFLGSYATGWIFWAAGWWLARQPELPADAPPAPVLSWLLLTYAGHHLGSLSRILNAMHVGNIDAGMVPLGQLGMLPTLLLLLAAIGRRRLPREKMWIALGWFFCLVPLAGMIWTGRLWGKPAWMCGGIAVILAVLALPVRSSNWLRSFAGMGRISYAFYVIHFPLLFLVAGLPLPGGTVASYFLRVGVWAALSTGLAWLLELHFQPWIKARLPQLPK